MGQDTSKPRKRWWRRLLAVGVGAGALGLSLLGFGCAIQRRALWPMSTETAPDLPPPSDARICTIELGDGKRAEAWLLPGAERSAESPGPAVIYGHGNYEVIGQCLELAAWYRERGVSVLLPEYRGYGRSDGVPGRQVVRGDLLRFRDWLLAQPEVAPGRLFYHGRSLGGAVMADLAGERPPAALILTSTFTSMPDMLRLYGYPGFLARDKYQTLAVVQAAEYPVLVLHGTTDQVIPVEHGRRLGRAGQHVRYVEFAGGHNDPLSDQQWEETVGRFLREQRLRTDPAQTAAPPAE